jgi:hypothetical protein
VGSVGGGLALVVLLASATAAYVADRDGERSIVTDGGPTVVAPDGKTTTVAPEDAATTTPGKPTGRLPQEVAVLVANGSRKSGLATEAAEMLVAFAYTTMPAADADQLYEQTTVFYREGYADDAENVGRALGIVEPIEARLSPMPVTPPVQGRVGVVNASNAHVIVVIGTDWDQSRTTR